MDRAFTKLRGKKKAALLAQAAPLPADISARKQRIEVLEDLLSQTVPIAGYLNKINPTKDPFPSRKWDTKYIILRIAQDDKSQLQYWRHDKDVARKLPLAKIDLTNTYIVEEGRKDVAPTILRPLSASTFYTWDLVDKDKKSLLRLSTDKKEEYKTWLAALAQAGCKPYAPDTTATAAAAAADDESSSSSLHAADVGTDTTAIPDDVSSSLSIAPNAGLDSADGADANAKKKWNKVSGSPINIVGQTSQLALRRVMPSRDRGVCVLGIVVMFVFFLKMVVENFREFGIRYNPFAFALVYQYGTMDLSTLTCCCFTMAGAVLGALSIEKLAARFSNNEAALKAKGEVKERTNSGNPNANNQVSNIKISNTTSAATVEWLVLVLHLICLIGMIGVVWFDVAVTAATNPLPGFAATFMMIVVGMKLISYIHVNYAHRQARKSGKLIAGQSGSALEFNLEISGWSDSELPKYPDNITMKSMAYFMVAPTLCYQLAYPWNPVMRPHMLMKRVVMLIFLASPMVFIIKQFIEPTIDTCMKPRQEMAMLAMLERVLKLGIPTLLIWLMMFYAVFHVWLNLLAEVTHYGDREFYSDWWNATTMGEFWKLWNLPVHKWILRHVYFPLGGGEKKTKVFAGAVAFFVSAVLHEVAVGMPLNMLTFWSFAAMMGQLPLIYLTDWLRAKTGNKDIGNAIFWISFCIVGQPLAMILYAYDYRMKSLGL